MWEMVAAPPAAVLAGIAGGYTSYRERTTSFSAPAAIDFLCKAFGFERHAVFTAEDDPSIVHHAQLVLDGNMIMLGSDRPGDAKDLYNWKTPKDAGCITMCSCARAFLAILR